MIAARRAILDRLATGAAVAVIRLRSMGDTVLVTPALSLLKKSRPDLRIFVALERPWNQLLEGHPDVTGVIALEANGGRPAAVASVRRTHPELCLNLHGGPTSVWMTALSGARWRAGWRHSAWSAIYNVRIPRAQEILGLASDRRVHTAEHLASTIFYLGAEPCEVPAARLFAASLPRRRPYAVLHVAAAYATKRWPAERFAALARWLRRNHGLDAMMLVGPGQEDLLAGLHDFECFHNRSVPEMMSLIQGAELFVGNDSGPAHVAAAFGIPCVVIFGSSDSGVWGPWGTRHEVVETSWDCKPCPGDRCYAFDRPHCILSVEIDPVRQAVLGVLAARSTVPHD